MKHFIPLALIALITVSAGGCGSPSFLVTPVQGDMRLQEITLSEGKGWSPGKVAVIQVDGMLMNARAGGLLREGENSLSLFTEQLNNAAADPDVKAIVLRINSPGGTVTTSDTMYQQILRFREKTGKPVIADFQEVAASGAYYLACAADKIVAHPTSVVGSIGVVFSTYDFTGAMDKIGMSVETIKSGELKDMGSWFSELSAEERQVMQSMVDEYYARFLEVVKTRRPQFASADEATVRRVTDGRVFSGQEAMELGLVDGVGLLQDAIHLAKEKSNSPKAAVVMYTRPYGYRGSIYAHAQTSDPQASTLKLEIPGVNDRPMMNSGFYYLWQP